ncbi:MAG TPA: hypothetical protein VE007_10260 [Thermoanaerobaculia bacterium]|nr:hypothetical protein [Thermoanaerobaculia bacterium]
MKTQIGTRRQLYILLGLGVFLIAVVRWRSRPASPEPAAPAGTTRSAASPDEDAPAPGFAGPRGRGEAKKVSPEEVPIVTTKDLEPLRAPRSAAPGRNIFDQRPPTPVPPPTATPAPPPPPGPGSPAFIGPLPPPPPTPTPAPPDVSFKFIGTFGPKDRPVAVLVQGDQIVNARAGDVVFDRFILRRVGYESVDVGFVGFRPTETRRLGITP